MQIDQEKYALVLRGALKLLNHSVSYYLYRIYVPTRIIFLVNNLNNSLLFRDAV
jgi:hypothetical protein